MGDWQAANNGTFTHTNTQANFETPAGYWPEQCSTNCGITTPVPWSSRWILAGAIDRGTVAVGRAVSLSLNGADR